MLLLFVVAMSVGAIQRAAYHQVPPLATARLYTPCAFTNLGLGAAIPVWLLSSVCELTCTDDCYIATPV